MQLWIAAVLLIACIIGTVVGLKQYGKHKKAGFIVLTALLCLLALILLAYAVLTLTLLGGID